MGQLADDWHAFLLQSAMHRNLPKSSTNEWSEHFTENAFAKRLDKEKHSTFSPAFAR
jgi:hypothetical protein